MVSYYYDRKGRPITIYAWAKLTEANPDGYCYLAKTRVGPYEVSTVWTGISIEPDGPPLIFETMIFGTHGDEEWCRRYATEDEAQAGHAYAVQLAETLHQADQFAKGSTSGGP